jgi:chemotaxis signal transduction protein
MTAGKRDDQLKLKTILDQISETGARSNALFSKSIGDLYETVLASSLQNSEFVSHLLVDLLDRNLYERSNDCRWWALTPELCAALSFLQRNGKVAASVSSILDYINRLYTVYSRVFVYDVSGCIVASTHLEQDAESVLGTAIDAVTLAQVHALRNEQHYHVTPFETTPLYGNQPTYIYHAAIRDPADASCVVGGIGIVFDSAPEFSAMLRSGLGGKAGMSAFFVDRQGRVISSTDPTRPVGSTLEIDPALLALPKGRSASRIVIHDGHYAIMGCAASNGYREFKVSDGYRDEVLAVVFDSFGEVRERLGNGKASTALLKSDGSAQGGHEFATFFLDGTLFALPAEHVLEALSATNLSLISGGERKARMGLLALQRDSDNQGSVWVYDLGYLIHGRPGVIDKSSQVIIMRYEDQMFGLLVGALHGVPEFHETQLMPSPFAGRADSALVQYFIKANDGQLLIQAVDIARLFAVLKNRELPT